MLENQNAFDQTGDTGSTLKVTNVGLDRADNNGTIRRAVCGEGLRNGLQLSPVTCLSSGAMALYVGCLIKVKIGRLVNRSNVGDLCLLARQRDAYSRVSPTGTAHGTSLGFRTSRSAILIHSAAANHRTDRVVVTDGI